MKRSTCLLAVPLLLGLGASAHAACIYPQAPQTLPNGAKATEEQMRAAQGEVKGYLKAIQEVYLPCLEQEKLTAIASLDQGDAQFESQKRLIESLQTKKHDAALDELQALADRWNQELKAYTEAQKK
jgi:hypothetical protein